MSNIAKNIFELVIDVLNVIGAIMLALAAIWLFYKCLHLLIYKFMVHDWYYSNMHALMITSSLVIVLALIAVLCFIFLASSEK